MTCQAPGGQENGVARPDRAPLAVNFHLGLSVEDEVDLLGQAAIVALGHHLEKLAISSGLSYITPTI